jgi:tetratricopeptide (TPR) repeat protein
MEESAINDNDEIPTPESDPAVEAPEQKQIPAELAQSITGAKLKTDTEPTNLEAWRELGNLYFDADLHEQAISAYSKALEINPNETNILNDQGAMYRQVGNFTGALANFEKARQVDPNNLESLYNSGYVLAFDLNQIDKALVLWIRYLALDQTSETSRQVQSFVERYSKKSSK